MPSTDVTGLRAGRDGPPTSGLAFVVAVASRPNPSACGVRQGRRAVKNANRAWKSRGDESPGSATFAPAQDLGMAGGADRLDHLEDALAHATLADLVVGAHQLERLALDQRILLLLE